ncbi:MAG: hypothetical protein WC505_05740 [Patescibacteria group bacterium]
MSLFCNNSVALVDLSNIVHRLWHIHPTEFELNFVKWLASIRTAMPGRKLIFAIEGCGTARRREIFPDYKMNREHKPEIEVAVDQAKAIVKHCDGTIIKAVDAEADDAIATWVKTAEQPCDIIIITRDHDLWQLIRPGVLVKAFAAGDPPFIDSNVCERVMGVRPRHIPMLKALLGDKSDNIPRAVPKLKTELLTRLAARIETPMELEEALTADEFRGTSEAILACKTTIERNWKITQLFQPEIKRKQYQADLDFFKAFTTADIRSASGSKL